MKKTFALRFIFCFLLFTNVTIGQSEGDVIVSEILQNPSSVSDTNGEWFEVYNTTNSDIDMDGWVFSDNGSDAFTVSGSLVVPAKGYIVLGTNDDTATNGGAPVDYEYSGFNLGNGSDEVIIETAAGLEIDRVEYDGGPNFPDPNGASMILLYLDGVSNDIGSSWGTDLYNFWPGSSGDTGTPGELNTETVGDVIISEIMHNPLAVDDIDGEWFEVYNTTDEDIDLGLWYVTDGTDNNFMSLPGLTLSANDYLVFGHNGDMTTNGGVALDFDYGMDWPFSLTEGADKIIMYSAEFAIIDTIEYTEPGFPNPEGASIALDVLTGSANDVGTNWITSQTPWAGSAGDLGSPGALNPPLPVELLSFSAVSLNNNAINLSWQTASEKDNEYFSIEHSLDGRSFLEIAKQEGHGTSYETQNYNYVHNDVEIGWHYYRLKQVDLDGTFEYSNIIAISIYDRGEEDIILMPNPSVDFVTIQSKQFFELGTSFQLINKYGQILVSKTIQERKERLEFDLSNLTSGVYYLKIFSGNKIVTKRIIKQRL